MHKPMLMQHKMLYNHQLVGLLSSHDFLRVVMTLKSGNIIQYKSLRMALRYKIDKMSRVYCIFQVLGKLNLEEEKSS